MTSKTHLTVKRSSKLHIKNKSVIYPLGAVYTCDSAYKSSYDFVHDLLHKVAR
jgi:hypothetical protein